MFALFQTKEKQLTIDENEPFLLEKKETILTAALRQNIDFPHSCRVGGCGSCKCKLLSGKVKELTEKAYLLSKEEINDGYILGCQSIPKDNVVVELPINKQARQRVTGIITQQRQLTKDIYEVSIELESPIEYMPGQYSIVKPLTASFPPRAYSFAHAPFSSNKESVINNQVDSRRVSFFVRAIPNGNLSHWLVAPDSLQQQVELSGGQGHFYLRTSQEPLTCIAGGSGLAPIIALLEQGLSQKQKRPVVLLFGARKQLDLYYLKEIEQLANKWPTEFKFIPVLSDEPEVSNWTGRRGFVTNFLTEHVTNTSEAYLCGPPPMIDTAIDLLEKQGVDKAKIFFDKFSDQTKNT